MLAFKVAILLGLLIVVYQDFKYRGIYWICFPLLAFFLGTVKILNFGLSQFLTEGLLNFSFLFLQIICLWGYIIIKHKKWVNITQGYIGWGDILFLAVMCFYFSPVYYIVFYIFSLITSITFALTASFLRSKKSLTIPLAGIQAIIFIILLAGDWFLEFNIISYMKVYAL